MVVGTEAVTIDVYRADYLPFRPPSAIWSAKFELDAASDYAVPISPHIWKSNWHEAVSSFYMMLLDELWLAVLGTERFHEVRRLCFDEKTEKASELMGELTVERLVLIQDQVQKMIVREFIFDSAKSRAELDREIARVLHQGTVRFATSQQSKADGRETNFLGSPDNPDVRDLCHLLDKGWDAIAKKKKTAIGIAREHTKELPDDDPAAELDATSQEIPTSLGSNGHVDVRADT